MRKGRLDQVIEPAELLAGPRGRRLCLEFAVKAARDPAHWDLGAAVMMAGYELDLGRGRSVVMMSSSDGADDDGGPDDAADAVPPSPQRVAELLDRLPLPDPDAPEAHVLLKAALGSTVDFARYWQEPDGEDELAAQPSVLGSLRRLAEWILTSPAAPSWSAPVDLDNQWAVRWEDPQLPPADPLIPAARLAHWRTDADEQERIAARDRPADPRAPWSGRWWSRPPYELSHGTRAVGDDGPIGLQLVEDSLGWERATICRLVPPADARLYEIEGPSAWAELCRRYPLELSASYRHDWYRATGRAGRWQIPDWQAVATDFDGVHLSVLGYLATAGHAIPVGDDIASVLAGWDPDQTWWLTTVSMDEASAQRWARSDDGWNQIDELDDRRRFRFRRSRDGRGARQPRPRA